MPGELLWGGPVPETADPDLWVQAHRDRGYKAAYWPEVAATEAGPWVKAAARAGLVLAEVGAWCNPLSPDATESRTARAYLAERLALADEVGALCCVNISGSRAPRWDGPAAGNFSPETFEAIVAYVRDLLDAVKPGRTWFTLELMPWIWPWDAATYRQLLAAVDRPRFAVHLDPANTIVTPRAYFQSAGVYQELFRELGPWIRSCHVKDLAWREGFPVHLAEVPVLTGGLDLAEYRRQALALGRPLPMMLEHLPDDQAYRQAGDRLRAAGLWS